MAKQVCTGCGSTETIEEIRAKNPQADSCCPERAMVPKKERFVRDDFSAGPPPAIYAPRYLPNAADDSYDNQHEAFFLLDLIVAEFTSDPMSVQCFDRRIVERAIACVKAHKSQVKREVIPPDFKQRTL